MPPRAKEKDKAIEEIGGEAPTNDAEDQILSEVPYLAQVEIRGVSSMIFHAWSVEAVAEKAAAKKGSVVKKTDNLVSYVYYDDEECICIPGDYLRGAIIGVAPFHQDPRAMKRSSVGLFKAGIAIVTELAQIKRNGKNVKTWDYVDMRRVTVQRAGITRSRPAFKSGWEATFDIQVLLPQYINRTLLHTVIMQAGQFSGFGDYRPTYGRFNITKFKVLTLEEGAKLAAK